MKRRKGREATVKRYLDAGATVPNRPGRWVPERRFRRGRRASVRRLLDAARREAPLTAVILIVLFVLACNSHSAVRF